MPSPKAAASRKRRLECELSGEGGELTVVRRVGTASTEASRSATASSPCAQRIRSAGSVSGWSPRCLLFETPLSVGHEDDDVSRGSFARRHRGPGQARDRPEGVPRRIRQPPARPAFTDAHRGVRIAAPPRFPRVVPVLGPTVGCPGFHSTDRPQGRLERVSRLAFELERPVPCIGVLRRFKRGRALERGPARW